MVRQKVLRRRAAKMTMGALLMFLVAGGAAALVVIIAYGVGEVGSQKLVQSSTSVMTTATSLTPQGLVNLSFARHLRNFQSANVTALLTEYEANATVVWSGGAMGLAGLYVHLANISLLYHALLSRPNNLSVTNKGTQILLTGGGNTMQQAQVNSTISIEGNATVNCGLYLLGPSVFKTTIVSQTSYDNVNGTWLISYEYWDFHTSDCHIP